MTTIVGYTYDADMWCKDCARDAGMTENGATDSEGNEPWPVFYDHETDGQWHCGSGKDCLNATSEHEYSHDSPIGAPIRCTPLMYAEEVTGIEHTPQTDDPRLFNVVTWSFKFKYELEWSHEKWLPTQYETINRGTGKKEYGSTPEQVTEAATEYVLEHQAEIQDELT